MFVYHFYYRKKLRFISTQYKISPHKHRHSESLDLKKHKKRPFERVEKSLSAVSDLNKPHMYYKN